MYKLPNHRRRHRAGVRRQRRHTTEHVRTKRLPNKTHESKPRSLVALLHTLSHALAQQHARHPPTATRHGSDHGADFLSWAPIVHASVRAWRRPCRPYSMCHVTESWEASADMIAVAQSGEDQSSSSPILRYPKFPTPCGSRTGMAATDSRNARPLRLRSTIPSGMYMRTSAAHSRPAHAEVSRLLGVFPSWSCGELTQGGIGLLACVHMNDSTSDRCGFHSGEPQANLRLIHRSNARE